MSDVASLELCKELYELSGWETESYKCDFGKGFVVTENFNKTQMLKKQQDKLGAPLIVTPAYTLGYLLRKLENIAPVVERLNIGKKWRASDCSETYSIDAPIPEDAACKLAIELFKQGILNGCL